MSKKRRIKPKVGDVFQIALSNGSFAYGKVFRDAQVGIYQQIFDSPTAPPIIGSFAFIVGLYQDILKSGTWPIVGHEAFSSMDDEWPPPMRIKDPISGGHSIYHKGEIRRATATECVGLETAAVWDADHIIDRLMGGTKYLN